MAEQTDRSAIDRILDESVRLFAARGFAGVSMTELAAAAQVSKANIFHHFANKDDLYLAALRHAAMDFPQQLAELTRSASSLDERIRLFVVWHSRRLRDREPQSRLLLRELFGEGQHGPEIAQELFGDARQRLLELVTAGQAAGELRRDVEPAVVALTLVAVDIFGFLAGPALMGTPDLAFGADGSALAERVSDLILHGALVRAVPLSEPGAAA